MRERPMRATVIQRSLTLALAGSIAAGNLLPLALGQETALPPSTPNLIMTNEAFEQWYQANAASHQGAVQDPIQPVSMSGRDQKTLSGFVEFYSYILGAGDNISVVIEGKPELSTHKLTINSTGIITLPLIGEITARGKEVQQLKNEITERYQEYLVSPKINLVLEKAKPQTSYVLGAVNRPGPYTQAAKAASITDRIINIEISNTYAYHLTSALASAGGLQADADIFHVKIFNPRLGYVKEANLYQLVFSGETSHDIVLNPDDVIYVPKLGDPDSITAQMLEIVASSNFGQGEFPVPIYGYVKTGGVHNLKANEMTLQNILAKAGGLTAEADARRIVIARTDENGQLQKIVVDSTRKNVNLKPKDIVLVSDTNTAHKMMTGLKFTTGLLAPFSLITYSLNSINNIWPFGSARRD